MDNVKTQEAFKRLDIMKKSSDGFEIAEKDLEIRGPGEFLGIRQSGFPAFQIGNIVRDRKWLELARLEAENYLENLFKMKQSRGQNRKVVVESLLNRWNQKYGLIKVG